MIVPCCFLSKVGDKVFVTQELDGYLCLGVCNDCYGKFPRNILRPLSKDEVCMGIRELPNILCYIHTSCIIRVLLRKFLKVLF